jgi:antitoxin Phd
MKSCAVQDAKAHFSELLNICINEGPQIMTRRGYEVAVIVPMNQWKKLNQSQHPSLKALLLSDLGRIDFELPKRGNAKRRFTSFP